MRRVFVSIVLAGLALFGPGMAAAQADDLFVSPDECTLMGGTVMQSDMSPTGWICAGGFHDNDVVTPF